MPVSMTNNPMSGLDARAPDKPGMTSFAITPSDTDELVTGTRLIWVGGAGAIKVSLIDDPASHTGTILSGVPAGTMLRLAVRHVYATGTTATLIVGFT